MRVADVWVLKANPRLAIFQKTFAVGIDGHRWKNFDENWQAKKVADMQLTLRSSKLIFAAATARSKCNVHDFFGEITFCASLRQASFAPNVHRKMILARRSSPRANRKSARSAPVPGRSNVANQAAIETSKSHRRPSLAAAGDGHTPPSIL